MFGYAGYVYKSDSWTLKRPQLQKLAKTYGIKGNQKSDAILAEFERRFPDGIPEVSSVALATPERPRSRNLSPPTPSQNQIHTIGDAASDTAQAPIEGPSGLQAGATVAETTSNDAGPSLIERFQHAQDGANSDNLSSYRSQEREPTASEKKHKQLKKLNRRYRAPPPPLRPRRSPRKQASDFFDDVSPVEYPPTAVPPSAPIAGPSNAPTAGPSSGPTAGPSNAHGADVGKTERALQRVATSNAEDDDAQTKQESLAARAEAKGDLADSQSGVAYTSDYSYASTPERVEEPADRETVKKAVEIMAAVHMVNERLYQRAKAVRAAACEQMRHAQERARRMPGHIGVALHDAQQQAPPLARQTSRGGSAPHKKSRVEDDAAAAAQREGKMSVETQEEGQEAEGASVGSEAGHGAEVRVSSTPPPKRWKGKGKMVEPVAEGDMSAARTCATPLPKRQKGKSRLVELVGDDEVGIDVAPSLDYSYRGTDWVARPAAWDESWRGESSAGASTAQDASGSDKESDGSHGSAGSDEDEDMLVDVFDEEMIDPGFARPYYIDASVDDGASVYDSANVDDSVLSAIADGNAPSATMDDNAPSAVVDDSAPSVVVDDSVPTAIVEDIAPSTIVDDNAPSAIVHDIAPSATADDGAIADGKAPSAIADDSAVSDETSQSHTVEPSTPLSAPPVERVPIDEKDLSRAATAPLSKASVASKESGESVEETHIESIFIDVAGLDEDEDEEGTGEITAKEIIEYVTLLSTWK
ncbi:hypothetical protein WOLCODRAFT_28880 [Wolfiporia cocos MD-104 SS10]|uniref:SAP domain-containing protein n=1 Tax=Wolfiporia cocos (strain MD-104) TaxID=742152 RepID=A0A2H3J4X7_WOLCO|nr:hypothetical protein WOLCODRAFT_28880 [Wolfiporia cocos MD-104 SS10]